MTAIYCDILSESDCDKSRLCYWFASSSQCRCNSTRDDELVFVMDSSGSLGSSGWDDEVTFVIDVVETGVNTDTVMGIVQFSSVVTQEWDFADSQTRSAITTHITNMEYTQGATYTS